MTTCTMPPLIHLFPYRRYFVFCCYCAELGRKDEMAKFHKQHCPAEADGNATGFLKIGHLPHHGADNAFEYLIAAGCKVELPGKAYRPVLSEKIADAKAARSDSKKFMEEHE